MLKPAVYLLMTLLLDRAFGQTFRCFPNQTIHFVNPDSSIYTHFVAFYDVDSVVTKCIGTSDQAKDNIYFDCASTTATVTAYFSDRTLSGDILGGKDTLACTLKCTLINSYIATIASNVDYSSVVQSKTEQLLTRTFDITDDIISDGVDSSLTDYSFTTNVSETAVGDVVFLLISSPAEYDVIPLSCNATGSGGESVQVINDCSVLSSSLIVRKESMVSMCNNTLYVYKFYSPDMLVVECDVIVCLNGSYPTLCNSDRKRRAIKDASIVKDDASDVKHIHVTKRWTIKDRAFGGSDHSTGSFALTLSLTFLAGIFNIG